MIDDDPMTDNRRAALEGIREANTAATARAGHRVDWLAYAQVFATLDLADATREQTAQLEAIDVGRRLGRG